jgi:hypothetical protein
MLVMPPGNKPVVDSLECTYCFVEEARARVLVIRRSTTDGADEGASNIVRGMAPQQRM